MKDSDVIYYVKIGFLTACEFLVPSEPQAYHFPLHLCNFFPWIIYPCNFLNKFPFSALATIGFLSLGIYSSNSYLVKVLSMLKRHSGMSWRMISLSVQFSRSVAQSCPTLCDPMDCSTAGLPVHHQLLEFTQTHAHWVGDAIQPSVCPPLLLPPSIIPSVRVFSNESVLHIRWTKYWSFSISPSNEYSGLISMIPPSHLILCHPLRILPSIFPSVGVFSNESALRIRWPNIRASVWGSVFPWKFRVDFL